MSKSQIFIFACASFVAGVFLASISEINPTAAAAALAAAVAAFSLGAINGEKRVFIPALFVVFFLLGVFRLQTSLAENQFSDFFGSRQEFEGYLAEDPDIRPDRQLLAFLPDGFGQKILVTAPRGWEYFYGDRVAVSGKPVLPKKYEDFDYQKYLERHEVYALMSYPKILVLKTGQLNPVKYRLLKLKQSFVSNLSKKYAEPQLSLLLGVLIGAKKTLPEDLVKNFQATGLSHIVAVSGYNITLLASALGLAAYFLGRRLSFWFSLSAIFAFAVIAGWSASVVRAAVMGAVLLLGFRTGRPYAAGPGICLAAAVMVAFNPRVLLWDIGFQLSFAATLGIVYGLPLLEKLFGPAAGSTGFRAAALSSFAAIAATLPLSLAHFGQLPTYALLANLLVLPLVPYIMLFGFLSLVPYLGPGFAFLDNFLLQYVVWLVGKIASWPGAVLTVNLGPWAAAGLYALLLTAGIWLWLRLRPG